MKSVLIKILLVAAVVTCGYFLYRYFFDKTEKYLQDLKSENTMVVTKAAYYLGGYKEKAAVPMLTRLVTNEQPKDVRLSAIEALGKICMKGIVDILLGSIIKGDEKVQASAVDALVGVLSDNDAEIRIAAVDALGKIKDKKAVKVLIGMLEDHNCQLSVIRALGNIGDPSAVPALKGLVNNPDKFVSHNAALALKEIGEGR